MKTAIMLFTTEDRPQVPTENNYQFARISATKSDSSFAGCVAAMRCEAGRYLIVDDVSPNE